MIYKGYSVIHSLVSYCFIKAVLFFAGFYVVLWLYYNIRFVSHCFRKTALFYEVFDEQRPHGNPKGSNSSIKALAELTKKRPSKDANYTF